MGTKYERTVQGILQAGLKAYRRTRSLPYYLLNAAYALRDCKTAALGGHVKRCPHGHVEKAWYNSCRHRVCPQCSWGKVEEWLDRLRSKLLPTDHYHATFTLPEELRVLWQFNKELVGNLMFTIAQRTLFGALRDPKHLGAKPGILMALHTWSRALLVHVHLHCLVTGGGMTSDGQWKKPSRDGFLVPDDRLSARFRRKFCDALERRIKAGKVELPLDMTRIDAFKRINAARQKTWIVDIEERYEHGQGVATYLAKYVKGGPIKNQRIVHHDGETVRFRTSRKGEKLQTMTLTVGDFIGRLLEHVPPIGYRMVRACGLYHHHYRAQLEDCRRQLGGGTVPDDDALEGDDATETEADRARELALEDLFCPVCGSLLEIEAIPRAPPPPELAKYLGPIR